MNIYVLSALSTYIASIDTILQSLPIKGVIGLSARDATDSISGLHFYEPYCAENGLDFHAVESYSLNEEEDAQRLSKLDIDVLLVLGWQRLIPSWLIQQCKVCAIGAHGSSEGITMGRGRSPQNWALLLGHREFHISIFQIDEGIDAGSVIDTRSFAYNEFDTIQSSYHKVSLLTGEMIVENIANQRIGGEIKGTPQEGQPRYLPQRKPEDGEIDWRRSSRQVHDFIRALSQPYPGAWSALPEGGMLRIWRGEPFAYPVGERAYEAGEIVACFHTGEFVLYTAASFYLVREWSCDGGRGFRPYAGLVLPSADFQAQLKRIVDRHYARYPDLSISDAILSLLPWI